MRKSDGLSIWIPRELRGKGARAEAVVVRDEQPAARFDEGAQRNPVGRRVGEHEHEVLRRVERHAVRPGDDIVPALPGTGRPGNPSPPRQHAQATKQLLNVPDDVRLHLVVRRPP